MSNVALFQTDFNTGSSGLVATPDAFGDSDPRYVKAERVDLGGSRGGALSLVLGGVDNTTVRDISGAWEKSFSLASEAQLTLTFSYNLTQSPHYESDEYSDVLVSLDGVLFGTNGKDYVARVVGDGNGGPERSTGWVTVELDLGLQPAGTHTIAFGGFNNKKTYNDEWTNILFDDVQLDATTFTPNVVTLVNADFEGSAGGFSYSDDAFGTNNPAYASGATVNVGGERGGVLSLELGGIDHSHRYDMSGGWEKSFTLDTAGDTTLTFSYKLTLSDSYESDEYSEVLVAIDGVLLGTGVHDYVARVYGNGKGNGAPSTGWVTVELNLGELEAGAHTVTIGGFNNKKTERNEYTEVLIDDVLITATIAVPHTDTIFKASFDSGTDGFTYRDDVFGTSHPTYANGTILDIGGERGGVLAIEIGGIDNAKIQNMSGGWEHTFTVDAATPATLTFMYKMTQTAHYESNEFSELRVAIDGKLVGSDGKSYVARLVGDGNGGPEITTGWQTVELDLGDLGPGQHTLTIGGFNNQKTYHDESTQILIDDVLVSKTGSGGGSGGGDPDPVPDPDPIPDPDPVPDPDPQLSGLFEADFSSGTEGFVYRDDVFGTNRPAYASGARVNLGGEKGGALSVKVGGIDNTNITNGMSGGWEKSFTVSGQTAATLSFSFNMSHVGRYDADEYSEVRVAIDGQLVGTDGTDYVARLVGSSWGASTGWQTVEIDLGLLSAGEHTLTIGGFNNKKTKSTEAAEILIDDVVVATTGGSGSSGGSNPEPQPSGFFVADFSGDTDGFVYHSDAYGTSKSAYAGGARVDLGGARGGVLSLELGGQDNTTVKDMSATWEKTFTVASQTDAKVSFRYNMTQAANYESNEFSDLWVAIDGKRIDVNGKDYVVRIVGDGNGGPDKSTGWQVIELDLGKLAAGEHTLTIGGYNNQKTYHDEWTEILIDDVEVSAGKVSSGSSGGSSGGSGGSSGGTTNHAPIDIDLSNTTVVKNVAGAVVGSLSVVDPDQGDTHTFTLNDSRFTVENGVLKLKNGQSLSSDATVKVTATDSGGLSYSESFKITTETGAVFTGNIINAASGKPADLQAAINKAKPGDIVKIPAGTWEFNSEVIAPDGIHIMGAGRDKTILKKTTNKDNTMITVDVVNHEPFKLSGVTLMGSPSDSIKDIGVRLRGGHTDFEIFDSRFTDFGTGISVYGRHGTNHGTPSGVIYGNEFIDIYYMKSSTQSGGYAVAVNGDDKSPNDPVDLGSDRAVYVEDNLFRGNHDNMASNNNSRYVFRYNTVETMLGSAIQMVDAHGLESWPMKSASYEIYGNDMTNVGKMWAGIGIRGGEGVIFDNQINGTNNPIILYLDAYKDYANAGTQDQIHDLWIWGNTANGKAVSDVSFMGNHQPDAPELILEGRDYFLEVKPGYSPFVYPHPLRDDTVSKATNGDDVLRGDMTDDIIFGLDGNDDLKGLSGDDVLIGGRGSDTMTGGAGQDVFLYLGNELGTGVDLITDFEKGKNGDKLDIAALLTGFTEGQSNPSAFVRLVGSGGNTKVQVDANGPTNGAHFVDLVVLEGVTGLTVNGMLQDGNLVLA